jgi:DtxR family Mn-dependent transcriptional regulator
VGQSRTCRGGRSPDHPPGGITWSEAECLRLLCGLEPEAGSVTQTAAAELLGVTSSTVNEKLGALEDAGLARRSTTTLTPTGRRAGSVLLRRERIIEHVLLDLVGTRWSDVPAAARRLVRVVSPTVEQTMWDASGRPARCPYGNPIPGEGAVATGSPLSEAGRSEVVTVVRIAETLKMSSTSLAWLERAGLVVGAVGCVLATGPDGTVTVQVGDLPAVGTGPAIAGKVLVERATPCTASSLSGP